MASGCGGTEADWQKLISAAQDEGKVAITGPPDPNVNDKLPKAFDDAFGISVEYTGGGSTVAAKIATERDAGVYSKDIMLGGANTMYTVVQGGGWLDDLKSALISPTVLEPATWSGNEVPFKDPDGNQILEIATSVIPQLTVNTDKVKTDSMGMEDLLDPEWKGQIVMVDPSVGSGTQFNVTIQALSTFGESYLEKLFDGQKVTFTADARMAAEGIAKGQYAIGIGIDQQAANVAGLIDDGLPIEAFRASDVQPLLSGGWGLLGLMKNAPNPEAAKLFANWLACPEGNKVWSDASLVTSARVDVQKDSPEPPAYAQIDLTKPFWDTYAWDRVTGSEATDTLAVIKSIIGS